ncbi:hypothetical protein ACP3V3_17005 [Vibrio sp. PNB22_3_1]
MIKFTAFVAAQDEREEIKELVSIGIQDESIYPNFLANSIFALVTYAVETESTNLEDLNALMVKSARLMVAGEPCPYLSRLYSDQEITTCLTMAYFGLKMLMTGEYIPPWILDGAELYITPNLNIALLKPVELERSSVALTLKREDKEVYSRALFIDRERWWENCVDGLRVMFSVVTQNPNAHPFELLLPLLKEAESDDLCLGLVLAYELVNKSTMHSFTPELSLSVDGGCFG